MSYDRVTLETIEIASPCEASWDAMKGDDRSRLCDQCQLNVYNIAGMTRAEAETMLSEREGRLCVRILRRFDGTVITSDCPIGVRALRRGAARMIATLAAVLSFITFGAVVTWSSESAADVGASPLQRLANWIDPPHFTSAGGMM